MRLYVMLRKNRSLNRTTWCGRGTEALEQVHCGHGRSSKAGGEPLLTWALRGRQEGGCVSTRLNRAPAFPVYLEGKKETGCQTVGPGGMLFQLLQVHPLLHHSHLFPLKMDCKVGKIILRKKYLCTIHTRRSIINALGRFLIKLRHVSHFC